MKKQHFLIAGLLVLTLAAVLQMLVFSEAKTDLFVSYVKERIAEKTDEADKQIFQIKKQLKKQEKLNFHQFLKYCKYPTLVYRNKKLLFWSDHTIYIDYYDVEGYYDERCFKSSKDKSIYLAKKSFLTLKNQDYEVVVLLPLYTRYQAANSFLSFTLNPDIFLQSQGVSISLLKIGEQVINQYDIYLFSILFSNDFTYYSTYRWIVLVIAAVGLTLLGIRLAFYLKYLLHKGKAGRAFLLLIGTVVASRAAMLYYDVPYSYLPHELFDSRLFASSFISPSLGDLLLNVLAIAVIGVFIFNNYPKIIKYRKILPLHEMGKSIMTTLWVIASYAALYSAHYVLETMLSNSIYSSSGVFVDISKRVDFSLPNLTSLLIFILVSAIYFIIAHIAAKLLSKLGDSVYDAPIRFVAGSLIFYLFNFFFQLQGLFLFNLNALYLIFITFFNLPYYIQRSNYSAYIYLFSWAIVSATVGAYSIVRFHEVKDLEKKTKYATKIILENDQIAEFYLNSLVSRVKEDDRIPVLLETGKVDKVLKKVRYTYMKQYLDKYQVKVHLYNSNQEVIWGRGGYMDKAQEYRQYKYRTEYDGIYFVNQVATGNKEYAVFIEVTYRGTTAGYIVLNLRQRKVTPNSIQQNFFIKQHYYEDYLPEGYSYAIYRNGRLIYSLGSFGYDDSLLEEFKHPDGFWIGELEAEGYKHLLRPSDRNQQIIVTSSKYPINDAFTNFSFLFLLLIFSLLIVTTAYNIYPRNTYKRLNFNTKVQIYLNFAFFIPLIVVSLIIVSILNDVNREDVQARYLETAQNIANELRNSVEKYHNRYLQADTLDLNLEERVERISSTTQADIDLFDINGEIMMSSQQYIYENQLLSGRLNPDAYAQLIEQRQNRALLTEKLGVREFSAAYVSIRSSSDNEVIAVVGVPFFGSKSQAQIVDVLSKVMQVFAIILILLLGLSYASALSLTAPLRLLRQKLRMVSFQNHNKPLDYRSDDEIGLLVKEYNRMLLKLEESRKALSKSEKESAWREMAKQVAHEIKNPLTPMKLNLQQLQRVLDKEQHPMAGRSIQMLISQIDTLSDIATSFSAFARMPLPTEEPVDLCKILRQVVSLHENRSEAEVELDLQAPSLKVSGDQRLLSRVFTNLIINGIQAVPKGREVKVAVLAKARKDKDRAVLQFTDNGTGIPEEARNKVFMPNFTTKSSGSGIGLAIAKRGIEQLGGRIWFETEIDKGTSFFIEMPLLDSE